MWWLTNQKVGANALGLQRNLGLGSYRTAWLMLHKLRRAMVRPERELLTGTVEVDETYVGGKEPGVRGRQTFKKALVVIAAEARGRGTGRIRMRRVPKASWSALQRFVIQQVSRGSVVCTDDWGGYRGLQRAGYRHRVIQTKSAEPGGEPLPRVHRVAAHLKRWLLGTLQGAVSPAHLDSYLEEFTFRFNRRRSRYRGKLFYRLAQQVIGAPPKTYRDTIRHVRGRQPGKGTMGRGK